MEDTAEISSVQASTKVYTNMKMRISASGEGYGQLPTYKAAAIRYLGMRHRQRVWQYA